LSGQLSGPPTTVPFGDLARSTAALRDEIDTAIARVLDRGWYVLGEEGAEFESEFAAYCGSEHAVGVASGTDAIELALRALEIGPGDEVVTQANTCVPTVAAIERAGATPVLCDAEPSAGLMDPESLVAAIGPQTRAVVPVHLYGQCADLDAISSVTADAGVEVIEDCAQAHGAELRGRKAGTIGRLGCFSFYPTKNLGALGDGGAVVTDDPVLADRLRLLREYGQTERYVHITAGVNSRLDELQAAVLRAKLPHLEGWNGRRREVAARYSEAISSTSIRPLAELPGRRHAYHLYVVETEDRSALQNHLDGCGVRTAVHYPRPIHAYEPYRALGDGPVPLTVSEQLCERVVSIPLYPELTEDEVEAVSVALSEFEV
jgi:dTDP-3-amino-3,4,6-trideoxy-alpha-D-glucose transaminase